MRSTFQKTQLGFICLIAVLAQQSVFAWEYHSEAGAALYSAYGPDDHGGGAISSDIAEDRHGNLFFANEAGLLRFDGARWTLMPDTGQADYTTSVAVDQQGRIWLTGIKHIGYYDADETGSYCYTDVTESAMAMPQSKDFGIFWKLYAYGDQIYLVTTSNVLRRDGDTWQSWPAFDAERRILPSWANGTLTIHARGTGLFQLKDGAFIRISEETQAVASGIISIISSPSDELLCVTVSNGLWRLNHGRFTAVPTDADANLKQTQTISAQRLQDGSLALASINKGVLLLDTSGRVIQQIRHDKGSSFKLFEHSSGSLWAGNTNAILEIPNLPLTHYADTAQDIARHEGTLYYTNLTELNMIEKRAPGSGRAQIQMRFETASAAWDVQSHSDDLLCAVGPNLAVVNQDTRFIKAPSSRQIVHLFQSWKDASLIYTSAPPHISRWKKSAGNWAWQDTLPNFNTGCLSLVELPDGTLLISSARGPLYRSAWSLSEAGTGQAKITPLGQAHGLPEHFDWAYCLRQGNTVVVISDQGLFHYDTKTEQFTFDPILGTDLGTDAYGLENCTLADQDGWLLALPLKDGVGLIGALRIRADQQINWEPWQLPSIHHAGKIESLLHEKSAEAETLWVGGSKDLFRYDLSAMREFPSPEVRLTSVTETSSNQTYYGGAGKSAADIQWSYPQQSLHLEYAATPGALEIRGYQTRLIGFDEKWSAVVGQAFRDYNNLHEGDYKFEVRTVDEFGRTGPAQRLDFTILPPGFRTGYAYAGYIVLGIMAAALLFLGWTQQLRRRNAELEMMVNQRTIELEHRNLDLIEANNVKQDFLANMSHEIRNPLNGILGLTRLMQNETLAEKPSERVNHLYACANHLHQLLGQILDYSSIESGKLELTNEPFDSADLVNEIIAMHQSLAGSKGLLLQTDLPEIHNQWIGAPTPLRQILINLISNAIKYTPSGKVCLKLRYTREQDNIAARFMVQDSGPGIPKDKQAYIFEQFTRLPKPGESQIQGTGLGLAIASELARHMQGTLKLDNNVVSGACFVLDLHFIQGVAIEHDLSSSEKQKKKISRPLLGRKVLIADDMDFDRYLGREILEKMGAQVEAVADGTRALETLETTRFDLAILDVNMPGLSGLQVVARALSNGAIQPPRFIALSASTTAKMEANCLAAGFDYFIEKPLDPKHFEELIDHKDRAQILSRPSSDNSLLDYLAHNDPKAGAALQARYRESCLAELRQLRQTTQSTDTAALLHSAHKLRGLANLQKNPAFLDLLDRLSTCAAKDKHLAQCSALCDQLEAIIQQSA
jgi:signal transduction histidine kinase/CheY-like chemotaxis protein